jgi:aryl-alcohol dehydrogenase-like predicted oxidoreductase
MLADCERHGAGFIPYAPIRAWEAPHLQQFLTPAAARHNTTTGQVALAWLLAVSPVTLPIPGTGALAHLEDNVAAASLRLGQGEIDAITAASAERRVG